MSIMDLLYDRLIAPAKEQLKEELLSGMDKCAKVLVVTRLIGEEMDIFDSVTYADYLNQFAEKHYEAAKGMDIQQMMAYMSEGIKHDSENV